MTADLAQPRERGEHVHLALVEAFLGDGLHDLLAAAAQFGEIKFPLFFAQFAIAALLDAVRQILRDLLLQAAQQAAGAVWRKAVGARCAGHDSRVFAPVGS